MQVQAGRQSAQAGNAGVAGGREGCGQVQCGSAGRVVAGGGAGRKAWWAAVRQWWQAGAGIKVYSAVPVWWKVVVCAVNLCR